MTDNLATVYSNTKTDTSYFQAFLNKILLSFCVLEYEAFHVNRPSAKFLARD